MATHTVRDKGTFSLVFLFDPSCRLVPAHPALVNAIILVLHSVAGSTPMPGADSSSRSMPSSSYRDMPGEALRSWSWLRDWLYSAAMYSVGIGHESGSASVL